MTTTLESFYIYGIVAAGSPVPDGVRVVREGELEALVGPPAEGREQLERHDRVLAETIAATTVIPARFGMVIDSEEELREALLRRPAERVSTLLRELDGHVQMSLKAFYAGDAVLRELVASDPEIARAAAHVRGRPEAESRNERIWLGELVAGAVAARREQDERFLLDQVAPVVVDVRTEPVRHERGVLNAALLVRRDARAPLDAVVKQLAASTEGRMTLRYVGPVAPYSFADLELEWD
jgi:hypothetical protein